MAALLDAFNTEYDEYTPGVGFLTARIERLIAGGDVTVFLAGESADEGFALYRLRKSLWTDSLDAYLEELYVTPELRGKGIGRQLMEAAMGAAREAGAGHIDLGTSEADVAARALYEKLGFDCHEGKGSGPLALYYERDL